MKERVAITGIGVLSAAGSDVASVWNAIRQGKDGLSTRGRLENGAPVPGPAAHVVPGTFAREGWPTRSVAFAVHCAEQAASQARLGQLSPAAREATGLVLGACTGGMLCTEQYLAARARGVPADLRLLRYHECCHATDAVAKRLGIGGPRTTVSTACTSGAVALTTAFDMIRAGEADITVAGGVDTLTLLTLNGFESLLIVSSEGCRPFDRDRSGMNLGEGGALLVLEREEAARDRGVPVLAWLTGCGSSCDARHATAPSPDGIHRAMVEALTQANRSFSEVDYINAHGTGTRDNDQCEAEAIGRLSQGKPPRVSSTKRYFGHTLAGAGAIEAAVTVLALRHQAFPGNLGCKTPDPALGIVPVLTTTPGCLRVAMSLSLGFGGANSALVLEYAGQQGEGEVPTR